MKPEACPTCGLEMVRSLYGKREWICPNCEVKAKPEHPLKTMLESPEPNRIGGHRSAREQPGPQLPANWKYHQAVMAIRNTTVDNGVAFLEKYLAEWNHTPAHEHAYVIPVEWEEWDSGQGSTPLRCKRVTRLRCACGDEVSR